ncbi:hypothetical protein [Roseobacter phage RDJL3]|nr:hypothetical protein [Roseobacter phage RDJL3]
MNLVPTTPFTMTRPVAELLWGQILKDAEYFDQQDASRFLVLLEELGYKPEYQFMTGEYATLKETAEPAPKPADPTVPHHYMASLHGGSGGIYVSLDKDAARREAELDAGRGNIRSFRPATEDEVAWHKSMGGRIQMVDPIPAVAHAD